MRSRLGNTDLHRNIKSGQASCSSLYFVRLRTVDWTVIWPNFYCARDKICCVPNYFLSHPPSKLFPLLILIPILSPFFHLSFRYSSKLLSIKPLPPYPLPLRLLKTAKGDSRHHVCLRRLQGPFVIVGAVIGSSSLTLWCFHRTCSIFSVRFGVD